MILDCYEYYLWTVRNLKIQEIKKRKGNKNEQ